MNGVTHGVRVAKGALDKALGALMMLLLAGIVVLVLVQIGQRFVPGFSIRWTEEMSRYLYVYLTFLGSALLIKEKGHIVVDVVVERLPSRLRAAVYLLVQLTVLAVLYIFVSGVLVLVGSTMDTRSSSMPWFYMGYLYAGVWAGGILMVLYTVIETGKGLLRLLGRGDERMLGPSHTREEGLT